jgi:hypothetical protein
VNSKRDPPDILFGSDGRVFMSSEIHAERLIRGRVVTIAVVELTSREVEDLRTRIQDITADCVQNMRLDKRAPRR